MATTPNKSNTLGARYRKSLDGLKTVAMYANKPDATIEEIRLVIKTAMECVGTNEFNY